MDRDRRGDDFDPEVTFLGKGESYRPGGGGGAPPFRPGPSRSTGDTWVSDRRDERRDDRRDDRRDERREDVDSYVPSTSRRSERPRSRSPNNFRRRSRSPPFRGRDDRPSARPRSPRRFSPRRGERMRSPARRRSRSPYNNRLSSPPMKRGRELSPSYGRRSPPSKREKFSSPNGRPSNRPRSPTRRQISPGRESAPRGFGGRSRTPDRRERRKPFGEDNWRRRSPSADRAVSGPVSAANSRRSSPPIHPDRMHLTESRPRSPHFQANRFIDSRPPAFHSRQRSPGRRDWSPANQRSPRSFVDRTRHDQGNDAPRSAEQGAIGPSDSQGGVYGRGQADGSSQSEYPRNSPPTGPSTSASMSARNRPNPGMLAAPTRPRGAPPGRFDGPPRDFSSPAPRRGGFGGPPPRGGQDVRNGNYPGSRGSYGRGGYGRGEGGHGRGDGGYGRGDGGYGRSESGRGHGDSGYPSHRPSFGRDDQPPSFRQHNNSSSTTYPRTQRFNTSSTQQHLSSGEKIIPGGKLAPSGMNPESEKRVKQLEDAAEKLREEIEEKQRAKREALREWDVRQRESEREGLRSELAERHLEKLTEGENGSGAAF